MDTFCGCDTETLDDLAERVREGALRLIQLIELLREAAEAVDWTGPDADAHRHRTATMAEHGLAAGAAATAPDATATAEPPDEPPGVRPGRSGLSGAGRPVGSV